MQLGIYKQYIIYMGYLFLIGDMLDIFFANSKWLDKNYYSNLCEKTVKRIKRPIVE